MTKKVIKEVKVLNTNPPQVCVIYTDGTGMTMMKSEWDSLDKEEQ